jgi:PAS domain S-box-containing protein
MADQTRTVSEDFFIDVYERAPDMYSSVDLRTGEIVECNLTFAGEIGLDREEILGRDELDFFADESKERVLEAREHLRTEGVVENVDVTVRRADGTTFDALLSATAIREDGEVTASRSALRDVTELKETERRLRDRTRRLEQSNEELEQFAYLASHDLQEPLRMVASYTQLLARRYEDELDERAQKYIGYAVEGAERMKTLLNDLLEYSRIGRPDDSMETVELQEILDSVQSNLTIRIREAGAQVDVGDLPAVYGDRTMLISLFQNLIENGIKFSEAETPRVEVEAVEVSDEARTIEVRDNGIGFDTDNADRMFQMFQRLNERSAFEGTGTGLAIVKKIVDAHGGDMSVDSTPGEGSCFRVTLPPPRS